MIAIRGAGGLLFAGAFALMAMAHIFSMNDNVHHQAQRPQGRADKLRTSRSKRTGVFGTASKAKPRISSVL
jgi:hypothetical protein